MRTGINGLAAAFHAGAAVTLADAPRNLDWEIGEEDEPRRIETGLDAVGALECDDFTFVHVRTDAYKNADGKIDTVRLMRDLQGLAERPGTKVIHADGLRMSRDDFLSQCPYGSEAMDGLARGYSKVRRDTVDGHTFPVAEVTDHHGPHRHKMPSTCRQVFEQEVTGTLNRYRLPDSNEPVRNVFYSRLNDLDEVLSAFGRVYGGRLRAFRLNGKTFDKAREMFELEDKIDTAGAGNATAISQEELERVNYINEPLPEISPTDDAAAVARKHFDRLRSCFIRAQRFIRGEAEKARLVFDYVPLRDHKGWATIHEPVCESGARWKMSKDGVGAALIIKKKTEIVKDELFEYSLHKMDAGSHFPLGEDMYGFLSYLCTLPKEVSHDEDRLRQHLREFGKKMPPFVEFARKGATFGGDDVVGGGKTTIPWNVLDTAIAWYLKHRDDTPEDGDNSMAPETLAIPIRARMKAVVAIAA